MGTWILFLLQLNHRLSIAIVSQVVRPDPKLEQRIYNQ